MVNHGATWLSPAPYQIIFNCDSCRQKLLHVKSITTATIKKNVGNYNCPMSLLRLVRMNGLGVLHPVCDCSHGEKHVGLLPAVTSERVGESEIDGVLVLNVFDLFRGEANGECLDVGMQVLDFTTSDDREDVWRFLENVCNSNCGSIMSMRLNREQ
jgi:hypothetical protein